MPSVISTSSEYTVMASSETDSPSTEWTQSMGYENRRHRDTSPKSGQIRLTRPDMQTRNKVLTHKTETCIRNIELQRNEVPWLNSFLCEIPHMAKFIFLWARHVSISRKYEELITVATTMWILEHHGMLTKATSCETINDWIWWCPGAADHMRSYTRSSFASILLRHDRTSMTEEFAAQ